MTIERRFGFGVAGGMGALAGADVLQRLISSTAADSKFERHAIIFEQQRFPGDACRADAAYDPTARKLHAFNLIQRLEARGADAILLPCFISQAFVSELAPNVNTPIIDLMAAMRTALETHHYSAKRIGILTSTYVQTKRVFEKTFDDRWELIYPDADEQALLMDAIYAADGIKAGRKTGPIMDRLAKVCTYLSQQGCDIIMPGFTELSLVTSTLQQTSALPVLDPNQSYVDYALGQPFRQARKAFKIGVVGGVGPLATANFVEKLVRLTRASSDQEHIKMVVEQNPQIPDRTAFLVRGGTDPTVALLATCKKLEAAEADLIAIPCNTAHAFLERITTHLRIPVLNMPEETMAQIAQSYPGRLVGLLSTEGTLRSGVYATAAKSLSIQMIIPDAIHQARIMEAIYGPRGVKAGYLEGECREHLLAGIRHLAAQGALVVILGCSELPLILSQDERFPVPGGTVALLDPIMLLAAACVRHARRPSQLD